LSSGKQCVELNGARSEPKRISIGVPQRLILGPLLFILYINDIANSSDLLMFILLADDTNIFYSCKNLIDLEETVNDELSKVSNWFRANKLSLNANKTNFIIFGNRHNEIKYKKIKKV